jgi:multicomponent K+:H+ antiporter subunit A
MDSAGVWLLLAAVFAPALIGAATMLLPRAAHNGRALLALIGPLGAVGAMLAFASAHGVGGARPGVPFVPSMHLNLTFNADGLGLFFGLLVAGVGSLIVLYARGYFGQDKASLARFYPPLGLFTTAMLGLVLSDDLLSMLLFWELTSVSSFLLIGWNREDATSRRLAIQALVTTGMGGMALLGGLLLLGTATGEWRLSGVVEAFATGAEMNTALMPWAFGLIFLGGATKSAQWPFHYWLPGAMAAPTPVSAFLHSATMVKAGVYLFGRLFPAFGSPLVEGGVAAWGPTLAIFGAATMLLGGYLALRSHELKRIFAYTTVSQLGLFTCMYGLGAWAYHDEPNLVWPVTQILNHALYKAPLFIIAGAIMHIAGRKMLPDLKGLWREHRTLALVCLLALYAMAGGPLTLSFVAKEAFFYQIVHAAKEVPAIWAIGAMGVLTAACNIAIFVRFLTTFLAKTDSAHAHEEHDHHEHERGFWGACIWWPAAFLVLWQFVGGIAPGLFGSMIAPVETHALYFEHLPSVWHALSHPGLPLAMTGIAIALGVAVGLSPLLRGAVTDLHDRAFPLAERGLERGGWRVYRALQTGNFRGYVYITLTAMLVGVGSAAFWSPALAEAPMIAPLSAAPTGIALAAVIATILVCFTAIALPIVRSRIVRVLVLGTCGFSVTAMYLLYKAPDLALTQLMFEIISVILFLLVLRMLPEEPKARPKGGRLGRAVFGGVVGVGLAWIVLHVGGVVDATPDAGALGAWFTEHSYEGTAATGGRGGGGDNIVNVILVDFRGYDTLGEITVLAIAAIGIFVMLGRQVRRGVSLPTDLPPAPNDDEFPMHDERGVHQGPQPALTSSLFRTSMRLILPLSLIFAAYLFFKGHNEPGGGFIAGLIVSVSLAVYRMAEGRGALTKLLPIKPGPLAAVGLTIALLTALTPLALGEPFLRSATGYLDLPGGGQYHWATVLPFDLGVMIVVVAVSVGVINRLTEELE